MRLFTLLCTLVALSGFAEANFFVQLKKPATMDALFAMDERIRGSNHTSIKPFVEKVVKFGDFEGFSGNFSRDMVKRLLKSSMVLQVVRDLPIKVFEFDPYAQPDPVERYDNINADDDDEDYDEEWDKPQGKPGDISTPSDYDTQFMAPRHLARLSRRGSLPYQDDVNFYHDPNAQGAGVYAYIVDTGINKDHPELGGRVVESKDFTGSGLGDKSGHGTHVAGLVGGKTFGVAKEVSLVDLKALGSRGEGTLITVLAAIQYAVHHREIQKLKGVLNLSLGSHRNNVLNSAIKEAVKSGLVVVVAAGNFGSDSCKCSPASAPLAISVGAVDDRTDRIALFSNWGNCVTVFASGVDVLSISNLDMDKPVPLSGTSMASPIVAGLAAVLLSQGVESLGVRERIVELATKDSIAGTLPMGTPSLISFNGISKLDDFFPPEAFYNEAIHGVISLPSYAKSLLPAMSIQDYAQEEINEWADYLAQADPASVEALFGSGCDESGDWQEDDDWEVEYDETNEEFKLYAGNVEEEYNFNNNLAEEIA